MEKQILIDKLARMTDLSKDFIKYLEENLVRENYKKGHSLVNKGKIVNKTWFVSRGLIKSRYYDSQGKQIVTRFWKEGEILILKDKDLNASPIYSGEDIVLLENSTLFYLPHIHLMYLYEIFQEIHPITRKLHFRELRSLNRRHQLLVMQAEQAYDEFGRYFPMDRIKQQDVAAYLNHTASTISRIRRKKQGKL